MFRGRIRHSLTSTKTESTSFGYSLRGNSVTRRLSLSVFPKRNSSRRSPSSRDSTPVRRISLNDLSPTIGLV